MIFPKEGYLRGLREICDENDIVLIFDEVWSGFRISRGGAAEYFRVNLTSTRSPKPWETGCIDLASENLVKFANVMFGFNHAAGRAG